MTWAPRCLWCKRLQYWSARGLLALPAFAQVVVLPGFIHPVGSCTKHGAGLSRQDLTQARGCGWAGGLQGNLRHGWEMGKKQRGDEYQHPAPSPSGEGGFGLALGMFLTCRALGHALTRLQPPLGTPTSLQHPNPRTQPHGLSARGEGTLPSLCG